MGFHEINMWKVMRKAKMSEFKKRKVWYYVVSPIINFSAGLGVGYMIEKGDASYFPTNFLFNLAFPSMVATTDWINSKFEEERDNKDLGDIVKSSALGAFTFFLGSYVGRTLEKVVERF